MERKKQIILTSVFTAISALITLCFCGFRIGFIFVDHVLFDGFCCLLWALFILNTVILFFQLRGSICGNRLYRKKLFIANAVVTAVSFACAVAFLIIGKDDHLSFLYVSAEVAPYLGAFYAFLFFALIFSVSRKTVQKCIAGVVTAAIVITALCAIFPAGGFSFESNPAVFDTGDGYHIVFATNRKSVGYVKVGTGDGEQIIWDTIAGRKESARIHSVQVPYDALDGNTYAVGAVRAVEDIAYGGHLGKEITQSVEAFTPCPDDDFDMTCVTDNHGCKPDWASMRGNADLFVFLGDIANGIYTIDSIIDNLVVPAGELSSGVKPVIYTLGNHDHRGSKVPAMLDALDFGTFYYRVHIGRYVFTVLDSGEDKEDGNYEYAGYNDFAPYFESQIEWAKTLPKESGYNVLITHSSHIFFEPNEQPSPMCAVMRDLGVELTLCGHSHTTEFVPADESETGIAYYICGGKNSSHDLRYTKMHFANGLVNIQSQNTAGETVCTQQVQLTEVA